VERTEYNALTMLQAGTRLGPYEILAPLGAGGMGEVYRARDTRLDRTVAVKVLPGHLTHDAQFRERFEREARAVSSLNHPNICVLHDIGEVAKGGELETLNRMDSSGSFMRGGVGWFAPLGQFPRAGRGVRRTSCRLKKSSAA
jgi:serine/threonine protein kinase